MFLMNTSIIDYYCGFEGVRNVINLPWVITDQQANSQQGVTCSQTGQRLHCFKFYVAQCIRHAPDKEQKSEA